MLNYTDTFIGREHVGGPFSFSQRLVAPASQVRRALNYEPGITPDFSRAGIGEIVVVMFCLMWDGTTEAVAIQRYLAARNCRFDCDTITFLLDAFEGANPGRHLWQRKPLGDYEPLFEALVPPDRPICSDD